LSVMEAYQQRLDELNRKTAENALLNRQIDEAVAEVEEKAQSLQIGQEALKFLEWFANSRRGAMKGRIESIITEALKLIYGKQYHLELDYSMKHNRSSMAIEVVKTVSGGEVRRDMGGFGGGVSDTVSVPMRLMVVLGSKQTDRICVLDECFKHVGDERVELVGKFLKILTDKLGFQIILCSHHRMLQESADKTFGIYIEEEDGATRLFSP